MNIVMKKAQNPMDLVDRYLQAVRFWLPKTRRQEELLAELGEDLRSQVEEKEAERGRPIAEAEVCDILKCCGSPMVVAGRLGPQRHLIGPTLYPIYQFVLKMVLLWILVPVFLFIVGPVNLGNTGGNWGQAIATTLGNLWTGAFVAAGVITLVFAILERTHALASGACEWDPSDLPPLETQERKISLVQAVCEFVFGCFGLVWLLLLPTYPVLILGPASAFLKTGPMLHTFYVPIVLLAVGVLLRSAIVLARPQWTSFPLWTQILQAVLTLILLNYMIAATLRSPSAHFVVLAQSAQGSAHYERIAAIVNASILISLIAAWVGVSIGGVIHTWELLRYLRKRISRANQTASVQLH